MGVAAAEQQFHVLAVDDSFLDRKLIERLLRSSSYQVTTVDSGSKALEFLGFQEDEQSKTNQVSVSPSSRQEQEEEQVSLYPKKKNVEVNLIITDYCMPGMTGYDLLKKIKESSSLRNIPVVIMSSENVPSRINRCLEEGAEEFFLKPMRLSDVNKLRPHMLKSKYGGEREPEGKENEDELQKAEEQQKLQPPLQTELQQQSQPQNSNKRKSLDEGISPNRARPRYSGLAVV